MAFPGMTPPTGGMPGSPGLSAQDLADLYYVRHRPFR